MAIIHRIGIPENDSEARAIKRFAKDLPDDYFVFHNFEVTTGRGLPYEYDSAGRSGHPRRLMASIHFRRPARQVNQVVRPPDGTDRMSLQACAECGGGGTGGSACRHP